MDQGRRGGRFQEFVDASAETIALPDVDQRPETIFQVLLETLPDAMFVISDDGRIVLVNAEAERLLGYRREELIGEPVDVLLPDEVRASNSEQFERGTSEPLAARMESKVLRRDGSMFPAEVSLRAIRIERRGYVLASVRDATERAEVQRHETDRMNSLGQLAGGVAHDFNNLLGVILNYAGFVARQLDDESPLRDDVEQIRRAAERGAQLTHQLLAFARREMTHPSVLDLGIVLADTGRLLRRTIGNDVVIDVQTPAHLWPVLADAAQLEQLLLNLALNARDAMAGGGTILLDAANVDVRAALTPHLVDVAPGRYLRFRVSDTGTGMDAATRARAFEPFFTTKPVGSGTGLGLAMAYGSVKQAGGDIRIDSELGEGTTVTVHLPAVEAPLLPPAGPSLPAGRGETILVVEDEVAFRETTRRILTGKGFKVLVAADGQEALRLLQTQEGADLVLTDVVMPAMAGIELARRVRELDATIPVVLMSGNAGPDGDAELLRKPFTERELLQRIRKVLDR